MWIERPGGKDFWRFCAIALFVCGCSDGHEPGNIYQPPEEDPSQDEFATSNPPPSDESSTRVSSGTIKSYLEDVELEPPVSTGSIFATGYSNPGLLGLGGAPNQQEWIDLLGLGTGDLTVLVVFDRSVSMSELWEGEPKWKVAGRAFMNGLKGFEETVTIGAMFFPQPAQCDVAPLTDPRQIQFQAGTRFRQHWEAFPQNRFPSGGTPLGPAFEHVDAAIEQAEAHGLLGPGRRFRVVVVTDGKPNCGTDQERVLFLTDEWRALGIEIHVIGLPGSQEAAAFLDQLASRGGTIQHEAPASESEAEEDFAVVVK